MKKCTKCKIEQAKENFHKDKNRPDGLYCYCRECDSKYRKAVYEGRPIIINEQSKKCHKCREDKELKDFHNNKTRSDGKHHWCKSCMRVDRIRYIKDNPEKRKATSDRSNRQPHSKFLQLKRGAKKRNLLVEINEQEYITILSINKCYYCNSPLNPCGHGMDRYDNNLGYTKLNTVPCCAICNSMKGKLHGAIFISHINKIITNNKEALFLP